MKLLVYLLLLIPVGRFLKFVLLDILDDLIVQQRKQKKSKPVYRSKTTATAQTTYEYRKAQ